MSLHHHTSPLIAVTLPLPAHRPVVSKATSTATPSDLRSTTAAVSYSPPRTPLLANLGTDATHPRLQTPARSVNDRPSSDGASNRPHEAAYASRNETAIELEQHGADRSSHQREQEQPQSALRPQQQPQQRVFDVSSSPIVTGKKRRIFATVLIIGANLVQVGACFYRFVRVTTMSVVYVKMDSIRTCFIRRQ